MVARRFLNSHDKEIHTDGILCGIGFCAAGLYTLLLTWVFVQFLFPVAIQDGHRIYLENKTEQVEALLNPTQGEEG